MSRIHRDFLALYPDSSELRDLKCEYLIATVALCHKIVVFARKSMFAKLASSISASFDAECAKCIKDIEHWGSMIEKRSQILASQHQLESDSSLLSYIGLSSLIGTPHNRRIQRIQKMRLLELLSPNELILARTWRRERKRGEVKWILEQTSYLEWLSHGDHTPLWVRGNLGSGKTVAMANIVGSLLSSVSPKSSSWTLSMFCQSTTPHSLQSRWILGSLAYQLLQQQEAAGAESVVTTALEKYMANPDALSASVITNLILDALKASATCFIILDALEECAEDDIKQVMKCLQRLKSRRKVHICWSSRNEPKFASIASAYMSTHNFISMSNAAKGPEMSAFIEAELDRRRNARSLTPGLEAVLKERLNTGAHGM